MTSHNLLQINYDIKFWLYCNTKCNTFLIEQNYLCIVLELVASVTGGDWNLTRLDDIHFYKFSEAYAMYYFSTLCPEALHVGDQCRIWAANQLLPSS